MIIHGQPNEDYHLDPAIGASRAQMVLDSIQLFRDDLDGITSHKPTKAKTFGTAFHLRRLQPELFRESISPGPINAKTGKPFGQDTKVFEEWTIENPGKFALSESELSDIELMMERCPGEIQELFAAKDGVAESSIYQTIDGVSVKCRPDWLVGTLDTDLKTIDDISAIRGAFRSYRYWFAQEWYKRVLLAETGKPHDFQFVFAEKKPPYRWKIVRANEEVCEESAMLVRGVLMLIKSAQQRGDWSDKSDIRETITWPDCGHYEEDVA